MAFFSSLWKRLWPPETRPETSEIRMSSYNGPDQSHDVSAGFRPGSASRKSSLATLATSQTRDSTLESHGADSTSGRDEQLPAYSDLQPLNFATLQQLGLEIIHDTQRGRQWLLDFGYLHEGTEVSVRLTVLKENQQSDGPHSLLPLLAKWIPEWYKLAHQKRKTEKPPRTPEIQEQEDFDWLLQYIADYLGIGHECFDEHELAELCTSITDLCQKTSRAEDINSSINILHNVMVNSTFPSEVLKDTLEMLCAATIILADPPEALAGCVRLLLSGTVCKQAVEYLLEFSTTPTAKNNQEKVTTARGAVRQLRDSIGRTHENGVYVIDMTSFLDALHQASKCCIFRHCTEILSACDAILTSRRVGEIITSGFARFLDTAYNCVRTTLSRAVVESERHNSKYLSERNLAVKNLLADLERVWSALSIDQQRKVAEFFMEHIKQLSDAQALIAISYLDDHGLSTADTDDWGQCINKIIESFVQNGKVSTPSRVRAITICVKSALRIGFISNYGALKQKGATPAAGQYIVDRLLGQLSYETDRAIMSELLTSLTELAFCTNELDKLTYMDLVVRKLLWLVKNERDSPDATAHYRAQLLMNTIQEIFVRSLRISGTPIAKVFDALLDIASISTISRMCRLAALRLLVRLRCDTNGAIYVSVGADSQYIAAAFCRTRESREAFAIDRSSQLWSYPEELSSVGRWDIPPSAHVIVRGCSTATEAPRVEIRISDWLVKVIECLHSDGDWDTYSFILVHLGAQLFNTKLFSKSLEALVKLRQVLCNQIINGTFREPPGSTGLKRSDTALCMFNMLTALIPYAAMRSDIIQKGFGDDLVRAFLSGIGGEWDGTSRGCIHALCICSFEIPASVASLYPNILTKMSKSMTQAHLTIHILEFLTQVARLPEVHSNFTQDEITMIFGICLQFLEKARVQHTLLSAPSPRSGTPARHSGLNTHRRPPYRAAVLHDVGLPQYASALAYHTMIFWFLSLKLDVRAKYVSWIVPRLVWQNASGEETIDEQSQVFIDMMQRTAYSDLGETSPDPSFAAESDGVVTSASWIVGLSIITAETAGHTGVTQITKRQAAGTTHAVYRQLTANLPSHHVPNDTLIMPTEDNRRNATEMLPPHILLQMVTTAAPTSAADQPIPLPREEFVTRALNVFDRIPTVDSHKLGVVYIAEGQIKETEFLANTTASSNFEQFLKGLGYSVSLEPPLQFNPQGLQYPRDGERTVAWRDRVTEIIYHVPTLMPNNLDEDPACNLKKSHVGNCNVIIVFNESGIPWKIENFPSQVTFVHVVISPATRAATNSAADLSEFYRVHVLTQENYPNVSPAADPKVISREKLPEFVRMFALNASVFSQAKVADDSADDEFPSSWRARLQQIKRLKERAIERSGRRPVSTSSNTVVGPAVSGRRTPVIRDEFHMDGTDAALAVQLDFGKWIL